MSKIMVEEISYLELDELEGTLDELTEFVNELRINYGGTSILEVDYNWHADVMYKIRWKRKETDEEEQKRLKEEQALRKANEAKRLKKEAQEKKQLKKLLDKYGTVTTDNQDGL